MCIFVKPNKTIWILQSKGAAVCLKWLLMEWQIFRSTIHECIATKLCSHIRQKYSFWPSREVVNHCELVGMTSGWQHIHGNVYVNMLKMDQQHRLAVFIEFLLLVRLTTFFPLEIWHGGGLATWNGMLSVCVGRTPECEILCSVFNTNWRNCVGTIGSAWPKDMSLKNRCPIGIYSAGCMA